MPSYGFGGNSRGSTGQMALFTSAMQIPFPSNLGTPNPPGAAVATVYPDTPYGAAVNGLDGAVRRIWATDDIWYGYKPDVTIQTGFKLRAGTERLFTARCPIWVVAAASAGESSSSSLSNVATSSSSFSDTTTSSSSLVPTDGSSSSSLVETSSSSHVSLIPTSSSSLVPVITYGVLYWDEECF